MEKRFKVLRFIGTLWKVLAWIELILGLLAAIGVLLIGLLGGGMGSLLGQLGSDYGVDMRGMPLLGGVMMGVFGFVTTAIVAVLCFLLLYAAGELIYLGLAIEENTRSVSYGLAAWMQQQQQQPVYAAPVAPAAPLYPPVQSFTPPPAQFTPPTPPEAAPPPPPPPSPTLPIQR
jgi:hypothetical protein